METVLITIGTLLLIFGSISILGAVAAFIISAWSH